MSARYKILSKQEFGNTFLKKSLLSLEVGPVRLNYSVSSDCTWYRYAESASPQTSLRWIFKTGCKAHPKPDTEQPGGVQPQAQRYHYATACATVGRHQSSRHCCNTKLKASERFQIATSEHFRCLMYIQVSYVHSLSRLWQCLANSFRQMMQETVPNRRRMTASSL